MKGMKKKERRDLLMRIGAVLIVICMIAALALPAFAADPSAEDKPYSYTVRIFPGDKGTINGSKDPIVREVEPGSKWGRADFDISQAAPDDPDRYYVMGLREAGRDNNTTDVMFRSGSFTVDRDIDLVVSYGIRGAMWNTPFTMWNTVPTKSCTNPRPITAMTVTGRLSPISMSRTMFPGKR